jgi:hypothetical protein
MPSRFSRLFAVPSLAALVLGVALTDAPAQPPPPQPGDPTGDGQEVLARGPVHEAFASTVEQPTPGEIAPKAPPAPVEELPPDQKPEGDNVQWIPGYWDWDDERADFIWVSGFWRVPPPNHVWVPGSWQQVADGFQWTHGFWQAAVPNQTQPEIEYLPQPPAPIEVGPATPAPTETSVYVPGSWVWRTRYVWRPGFWMPYRPGWVWVPAHFRWTPLGYVFIDGYWDYPLATRGVLFTPMFFRPTLLRPGFVFTPTYVVAEPVLFGALFVRRGYGSYYFGDYYDARYARGGFQPWCAPALRGSVAVVPNRGYFYDPLWSYYQVNHRQSPQWTRNVTSLYAGRYQGTVARPPHTLAQQNRAIRQVTNVTNVQNVTNAITVVNNAITVNNKDVSQHVMVAPLVAAPKLQPETRIQPITAQVRKQEAQQAAAIRQVAVARQQAEVKALKSRPAAAPPQVREPVKVKLDVPKAVVAKSQPPAAAPQHLQPPPPPTHPNVDTKIDPKTAPKIEPRPRLPKVEPKGFNPMPKVEPKAPIPTPKAEPKQPPKNPAPVPQPKVEPKSPTQPVQPKVEPKPPTPQPMAPPVQPKLPTPQPQVPPPRPKLPAPPMPAPVQPKLPSPPANTTPPKAPVTLPAPPRPKAEPKGPPPKVEPKEKEREREKGDRGRGRK